MNRDGLDLDRFWADNAAARRDPFAPDIPQAAMGLMMSHECVFDELGIPEDQGRFERDDEFARSVARAYNDRAEQIVGRRLLNENAYDSTRRFPHVKSVGELFGCPRVWQAQSWWLLEAVHTPAELARRLDEMQRLDLRAAMLPPHPQWDLECRRLYERFGIRPRLGHHLRGPVTLATSIFGAENLLYLIMDEPALAARFRDVLLDVILRYYTICDELSDPASVRPGFSVADDNCALLTPEMYAFFGQPILKAVFERFAPGPRDSRFQHSDSDMGHLLPLLAQTGLNAVNFGPKVRFRDIRAAMPGAVVHGTLAPFTLMRNDESQIEAEVRRDLEESRSTRGLVETTAGSVNNGSRLTSLRVVMRTIQNHGRYD